MSVAKHTAYNLAGSAVPLLVTIVVTPFYLEAIGVERYGILAIFWTLLSSLGVFSLGMGPAVAQRLASIKDSSATNRSQLVWTALMLSLAASLVGALLVLLIGQIYFGQLASTPLGLQSEIRGALPWLAAGFPMILLSSVFNGALQGRQRFGLLNMIQIATTVGMSLVPLAVAYLVGTHLQALIIGTVLVSLTSLIVQLLVCTKTVPLRMPCRPTSKTVKSLASYGGWVSVSSIVGPLLVLWDRFAIGALLGAAAVAAYVIPFNLVWQVLILPSAIASALFPKLAEADLKDSEHLRMRAVAILAFLMTPATLVMLFAAPTFLTVWLGQSLGEQTAPISCLLLFGIWTNSFARVPYAQIQARGRPKTVAVLLLAEALPYLALIYVCVMLIGLPGAAIAWSLRCLVDTVGLFLLDKTPKNGLRPLLAQAVLILVGIIISISIPAFSVSRLIAATIMVGGAVFLVWRHKPPELDQLFERLRSSLLASISSWTNQLGK